LTSRTQSSSNQISIEALVSNQINSVFSIRYDEFFLTTQIWVIEHWAGADARPSTRQQALEAGSRLAGGAGMTHYVTGGQGRKGSGPCPGWREAGVTPG
jgi:hypothetical protein